MRLTVFGVVLVVLAASATAFAQLPTPAIPTGVDVLVIPAAGDPVTVAPIATRSTPIGVALNCNLPLTAAPPVPLINPTIAEFDDPFTTGRKCRAPLPIGLLNGSYRAIAVITASCDGVPCTSPRSLVGVPNFSLAGPQVAPAAPTGLGLKP